MTIFAELIHCKHSNAHIHIKCPFILQWVVAIGWFVAVSMYGLVSYLPALTVCTESSVCGEWTPEGSAAYYSLNRVMWGIWVCWLILACATGYGGMGPIFGRIVVINKCFESVILL